MMSSLEISSMGFNPMNSLKRLAAVEYSLIRFSALSGLSLKIYSLYSSNSSLNDIEVLVSSCVSVALY